MTSGGHGHGIQFLTWLREDGGEHLVPESESGGQSESDEEHHGYGPWNIKGQFGRKEPRTHLFILNSIGR